MNVHDHDSASEPSGEGRRPGSGAVASEREPRRVNSHSSHPTDSHLQELGPEAIVQDPRLSKPEKLRILEEWAQDERQLELALEEGMPGAEPGLLRRILVALSAAQRL